MLLGTDSCGACLMACCGACDVLIGVFFGMCLVPPYLTLFHRRAVLELDEIAHV